MKFGLVVFCLVSLSTVAQDFETEVFSENTSFKTLLESQVEASRAPAGVVVKGRVIGVRRDLGLTFEDAKKSAQDIVVNAGSLQGLSKGDTLKVLRKLPLLDPYKESVQRELELPFATVEVVHVQDNVSLVRLKNMDSIEDGFAVGTRGVLVGDYIASN